MAGLTAVMPIDRQRALRYLGYTGQVLDADLERRFDEALAACQRDISPRCVHAAFPVDMQRSGADCVVVRGRNELVLEGRSITQHLKGAEEVVLLACTLGAANEQALRRLAALSPTDALLYGAISATLVEAQVDKAEAEIVEEASRRGLYTNYRFSPGYGDFSLNIQSSFLNALDASRRIGLTVTKENVLIPTKSVTAVVGLFTQKQNNGSVRMSCETCALSGCCLITAQGRTCHG